MRIRSIGSTKTSKFAEAFVSNASKLVVLSLLFAGTYSAVIIFSDILSEKAKIQENALLAGLVEEEWHDMSSLNRFLKELRESAKLGSPKSALRKYVREAFAQMNVELFDHKFQLQTSSFSRSNSTFGSNNNLYGIVRSFRAAPSEAILLVVPLHPTRVESAAVALAFVDYAKDQMYWSRDLIFLFVDGGDRIAMEAWLSAYNSYSHPFFGKQSDLTAHGGTIIAAFALDLIGNQFLHIEVQQGMIDGKLPNLDLLNLFILLVEKTGSIPAINGIPHLPRSEGNFLKSANTIWRGILAQSLSEPDSLTSVFGRYGLHALTLKARQIPASVAVVNRHSAMSLADFVVLVEGGMRSLNNLLEKFHHSYLLYVLSHPHRFVSVGLYMPLMGLLLAPLLILGLHGWLSMGGAGRLGSIAPALSTFGCSHLLALSLYALQLQLFMDARFSAKFHVTPLCLLLALLIQFVCLMRPISPPDHNLHFARFVLSVELALFLGALSLVHFSLALLLSFAILPLAISVLSLLAFQCLICLCFCIGIWQAHSETPLALKYFMRPVFKKPTKCGRTRRLVAFLLPHPIFMAAIAIAIMCISNGDRPEKYWHKLNAHFYRISLAHFVHGSWLLAILCGPVLALCAALSQLVFIGDRRELKKNGKEEQENNADLIKEDM